MSEELKGLNALGILDTLKNIGVYVVDVETTGLTRSDHMFSAAYTKMNVDDGSPVSTKESFFNIRSVKRPNEANYKSRDEFSAEIEKRIARAHSSSVFGDQQLQAGSLKDAAQAMADKKTITPATFLQNFSADLGAEQNGSIVLTHNAQFENNQFERLHSSSSQAYDRAYQSVKNRNVGNRGLFGADSTLTNWSTNEDQRGLSQRIRDSHLKYVEAVKGNADPSIIRGALGDYAVENKNLINHMMEQIKSVEGQAGKYVNLDTMPILRGLMSFGALNGDVDAGNMLLGGKVEHHAMAWFQQVESHTAGGDTQLQGKIGTTVLFKELEEYAKDPTRSSERMKALNAYINEQNVGTETFKSSIVSEITNTNKYKDANAYKAGVYDWINDSVERYSLTSGDHSERIGIANSIKVKFDEVIQEKPNKSHESIAREMETWIKTMSSTTESQKSGRDMVSEIASQGKNFFKNHKGKLGLAAAGLAASMFIDGSEKGEDKKYNTYDELYNNQYYGSGFADWQNRNNAHKVLY